MSEKVFSVTVKTRSRDSSVESFDIKNRTLTVRVKSPPEDNRANAELLKIISKEFGGRATIIKGHSSRRKLVRLAFPDSANLVLMK